MNIYFMIKMVCIIRAHDKCLTKMCKEKYLKTFESSIPVNACSIVFDTSALLLRYLGTTCMRLITELWILASVMNTFWSMNDC